MIHWIEQLGPVLQIRVWNLLDNHRSLPFTFIIIRLVNVEISPTLHCLSYFNVKSNISLKLRYAIAKAELCTSLLHKRQVAMPFPTKISSSCIWVTIPVDWVILHWYACGAKGQSVSGSIGHTYGHVITKISRMGSLPHFLRYGATLMRPSWAQGAPPLKF